MATETRVIDRIERDLADAESMVCFLPVLIEDWPTESIGVKHSEEMEWRRIRLTIEGLSQAANRGQLTPPQMDRYRSIIDTLVPLTLTLEAMEFVVPERVLLEYEDRERR